MFCCCRYIDLAVIMYLLRIILYTLLKGQFYDNE
nr:MAG TPA: hypothetical protein [Caudoviricetes sp.]